MDSAGGQIQNRFENKSTVANQVGQQSIHGDVIINLSVFQRTMYKKPF